MLPKKGNNMLNNKSYNLNLENEIDFNSQEISAFNLLDFIKHIEKSYYHLEVFNSYNDDMISQICLTFFKK